MANPLGLDLNPSIRQILLKSGSNAGALFPQDKGLALQLLRPDAALASQRMARAAGQNKLVFGHRFGCQLRAGDSPLYDGQIQLPPQQHLFDDLCVVHIGLDPGLGLGSFVLSGQLGQQARARCNSSAHSQQTGDSGVPHIPFHFVKQADNAPGVGQQQLALLRDAQLLGKTFKQTDAIFRLNFGHRLADSGLGDI